MSAEVWATVRLLAAAMPGARFRIQSNPPPYRRGSAHPMYETLHVITEGRARPIGPLSEPLSGLSLLILEQAAREECAARGWQHGLAYDPFLGDRPYTGFVRRPGEGGPLHSGLHEARAEGAAHAQLLALLNAVHYLNPRVLREPWNEAPRQGPK